MEFRILGPLELADGGRPLSLGRGKQKALLALLLLHANEVVSAERLIDELWGESPPATVDNALQNYVSRLRKRLGPERLLWRSPGYLLRVEPGELDLARFEALLTRAQAADEPASAAAALAEALSLWRGSPLADFTFEPFAQSEIARLEDLRLGALEERIEAELALGRNAEIVSELERLVAEHPLRERLRAQLMLALYRAGRQAEALAAYRNARRVLVEQLGIEPGPELQRLERAILQQDPELEPHPRYGDGRPTLPTELTTFFGREAELDELRAVLSSPDVRLVTLTGAGGSGKTRLAIRAAHELADNFKEGVTFVDLTPLADASLVVRALAQTLGVPDSASRSALESMIIHLSAKETLLVLDNFEHVLPAALGIAGLVARCPGVRVLATSRVPLGVEGEREFEVPPLEVPPSDAALDDLVTFSSVRLFTERARAIRHGFAVDVENSAAVGEICSRLDGLPLAIELAAARTRVLSPIAMLPRLQDRLGFGAGDDRPSRHRTLRSSIAWSHDLLGERERVMFRRLAVFRGGCTLAAVEAVDVEGGDAFATLASLVQHSLVKTRWTAGGEARFEMLETIAEFAREQLAASGELGDAQRRHATYYMELAETAEPHLYSDRRAPWLQVLADERDNIRAALAWSEARDEAEPGLRILAALWLMYWTSFNEGLQWAERLLPLPSAAEPTPARAGALFTAQLCAAGVGDASLNGRFGEEAVAVARESGDDRRHALALVVLSGIHVDDPPRILGMCDEALEIAARTGDPWVYAWMNLIGGVMANFVRDSEGARQRASRAVQAFSELGDSWSRASSALSLGLALLQLGNPVEAHAALEGSVEALLAVGDFKMANGCSLALAMTERFMGNVSAAEELYAQALALCRQAGDPANAPVCLEGLAACAVQSDPRKAARLLGAAQALLDHGLVSIVPFPKPLYESTIEALGSLEGELATLMEQGRQDAARGDVLNPEYIAALAASDAT